MDARPTLETVAQRAAVSRQTVSNVLNAPHLVRPETIERVRAAIDEVGYRPHGAARQLRTRRSRVIGMRLDQAGDGINGAVLDRFLHALTQQAQVRGYRIMLFTAADDRAEIAQYGELLDVLDIDAFVLTSTHAGDPRTRWLQDQDVPFVTFGRPWEPAGTEGDRHPWVDVDGAAGTRAAVEHLQALGHTDVAWIGWPEGSGVGDDRRAGWLRAVRAAGVRQDRIDALEVATVDGVASGAAAARRLLDTVAPTAVVCASDSLALGALAVLRGATTDLGVADGRPGDEGLAPGDGLPTPRTVAPTTQGARPASPTPVAVVGFDDTPVARAVGLTSVAQPLTEAAGRALDLLLTRLDGGEPTDPHVLLAPSLVVRGSSSPPMTGT